jgi:LPS sulfotransferase NodH
MMGDHSSRDAALAAPAAPLTTDRSRSPVFVVGCHRSGTNLLYDTLLSAGGFANYRGYLPIYKVVIPRVGPLSVAANRKKAIDLFLKSKGFRRCELDAAPLAAKLDAECRTGGDFIRIVMEEVARAQGVPRWAVYDPDYVLHIERIKRDLPNALFLHIIRDGRDIALSLMKMGGFRPFPWSSKARGLLETAVYWEWTVRKGQHYGRMFPDSYLEIHYEELVTNPGSALAKVSRFIEQDLDYDHIQQAAQGRLRESNSSFLGDPEATRQNPVNRWKERLSHKEIVGLESLVGKCLEDVGYPLTTDASERKIGLRGHLMRAFYSRFLSGKVWAKQHTPIGRFSNMSVLEMDNAS